jgi:superfamily I DNA and/or RNA helicase
MKDVCRIADLIMTTTTLTASRYVKPFTRECGVVPLDEASSSTELEALMIRKGDKPMFSVGDLEQLSPSVFSELLRTKTGEKYISHTAQLGRGVSQQRRLIEDHWPYIDCDEQY